MQPAAALSIFRTSEYYYFHLTRPFADSRLQDNHLHPPAGVYATQVLDVYLRAQLKAAIEAAAKRMLASNRDGKAKDSPTDDPLRRLGRVLYDRLLPPPIQQGLASLPELSPLILITNEPDLSWELLHNGRDYLAHRHPLARQHLTEEFTQRHRSQSKALSILLISNPTEDLPQSSIESDRLIDLFDAASERVDSKCLAGSQATHFAVLQHLSDGQYDIIHYSGHADPNALRLYDGALTADEIRTVVGGQPFVFLNACSTGAVPHFAPGDPLINTGLELQGLSSAFLAGGAAGVLSTNRPIFDVSSREFADYFYRSMLDGIPVGETVCRARQRLHSQNPDDPLWASYVLYGDPHLRLAGLNREEPRTVTLLLLRLTGLWQLYERLTLEQAAAREYQLGADLAQTARKYGGEIVGPSAGRQIIRFGLPQSHEDDAERAIQTALEIASLVQGFNQKEGEHLPEPLSLHLGVSTGRGIIRQRRTASNVEYQIAGPMVDRAAALSNFANDGQLLVDETTARQIERAFQCEALPSQEVDANIPPAYEVIGERESVAPQGTFIGREDKLDQLSALLREVRSRQGRLVAVVGAAGTGKSRLLQEFRRRATTEKNRWLEAACQSYDAERPYALIGQIVRQLAEIAPQDDEAEQRNRVRSLVEEMVGDGGRQAEERVEEGVALLMETLGYRDSHPKDDLERELRQKNIGRIIQGMLAQQSIVQPLVLILEDAQWIDGASLALLDQLTYSLGRMHLLILLTHRNEWSYPWPKAEVYRLLPLDELDLQGQRALVANLLGIDGAFPAWADSILEQIGGNPFYLVEGIRSLQESDDLVRSTDGWTLTRDLTAAPLPDRVETLIQDRIGRLDEESREMLRTAAVIGSTFEQEVLRQVKAEPEERRVAAILSNLSGRELIREAGAWGAPIAYGFTHGFIHQAAYWSLLDRARRAIHRLVARVLLRLSGDRATELIAYHYYHSDERVDAIRYSLLAARRAADAWDNRSAIRWYDRALEKVESFDQEPASIEEIEAGASADQLLLWQIEALEGKADAQSATGGNDEAIENYGSVLILASGLDDFPLTRQAAIQSKIAIAHQNKGDFSQARSALVQGLGILNEWQSPELGRLHVWLGLLAYRQGVGLAEGLTACERGIDVLERAESVQDLAQAYNLQGVLLHELGRSEEAIIAHERSAALYQEVSYLPGTERAYSNLGCVYQDLGRWDEALQAFEEAASLADKTGESWRQSAASINLGEVYRRQGRLEQAIDSYRAAQQIADTYGFDELRGLVAMNLGAVYLRQKQLAQALSHLQESGEIFRDAEAGRNLIEARRWLAEAYGEEGRLDEAVALAQEALRQATEQEVQIEIGHGQRVLGKLHRLQGEWERAQEELTQALANFEEHNNLHETALTLLERALLFEARASADGNAQMLQNALTDCESALEQFTRLGAQVDAQDARGIAERLRARLRE